MSNLDITIRTVLILAIMLVLFLFQFQEEKGVKFKLGVGLKEFVGTDGKLTGVKINTDEVIEADVAVMGIGVVPCTSYLKESALELSRRGEVVVDEVMRLSHVISILTM